MRIYSALMAFTSPSSFTSCDGANFEFFAGSCAFTLNWDGQFAQHNNTSVSARVLGNLGVGPLPGSTRIWNRTSDTIADCSSLDVCPLGLALPQSSSERQIASLLQQQQEQNSSGDALAAPLLVNRPGFSAFPLDRVFYDTTFSLPQQSGGGIEMVKAFRSFGDRFLQARQASFASAQQALSQCNLPTLACLEQIVANSSNFNVSYWLSFG